MTISEQFGDRIAAIRQQRQQAEQQRQAEEDARFQAAWKEAVEEFTQEMAPFISTELDGILNFQVVPYPMIQRNPQWREAEKVKWNKGDELCLFFDLPDHEDGPQEIIIRHHKQRIYNTESWEHTFTIILPDIWEAGKGAFNHHNKWDVYNDRFQSRRQVRSINELEDSLLLLIAEWEAKIAEIKAEELAKAKAAEAERLYQERKNAEWQEQCALERQQEAERKAARIAERDRLYAIINQQHEAIVSQVETLVNSLKVEWPPDYTLTLYKAEWCKGGAFDEEEGEWVFDYDSTWIENPYITPSGMLECLVTGQKIKLSPRNRENAVIREYKFTSFEELNEQISCRYLFVGILGINSVRISDEDGDTHRRFFWDPQGTSSEIVQQMYPPRWIVKRFFDWPLENPTAALLPPDDFEQIKPNSTYEIWD